MKTLVLMKALFAEIRSLRQYQSRDKMGPGCKSSRVMKGICQQLLIKYLWENRKMRNWESILKSNTLDWLLEKNNPSVRYFTLIDILDYPETDSDVTETKNSIMEGNLVSEILSKQERLGYWGKPKSFYKTKYKGTVWQLIILAELGAKGEDERIENACEFIFEHSQDRESGGFSIGNNSRTGSDERLGVIPCLTGNMVWSLIRFGYLDDPRIKQGINWITTHQRFDDGILQA
ncbi:MAG: hypothetical protein GY864_00525, partial [Desulfobacterales bacterium]|nr:hypothetical protein [Desulfobacterales bacterium]